MSRVTPIDEKALPASVRRALRSPTYAVSYVKRRYTLVPPFSERDTTRSSDLSENISEAPSTSVLVPSDTIVKKACDIQYRIKPLNIILASAYLVLALFLLFSVTTHINSYFDIGISRITKFTEPDRFSGNSASALYVGTSYITLECEMKGINYTVAAPTNTAREFVKSLGLGIDDDDILSCTDDTVVASGMTISVDIVDKQTVTANAVVPFPIETTYIHTIPRGQINVISPGVEGKSVQTVENVYVNGELTETIVLNETITEEPIAAVTEEGCGGTVTISGREYRYSYYRDVEATAYGGPTFEEGHTSTGKIVDEGMIAVDPEVIPLGSRVLIIGDDGFSSYDGVYSAEDTGGFIVGDRIDIYTGSDIEVATAFGRRNMRVYILE